MKNNILTVILVLKVYSTDLALHSYNILGLTVDSLKKNWCSRTTNIVFLVKICHLITHDATQTQIVKFGDSSVLS